MAAKRQRRHNTNEYSAYTQGNTVRKAAPVEPEIRNPERVRRNRPVSRRVKRNQDKALYMGAP